MSEALYGLAQALAAKPPGQVLGWRHGAPVFNGQFLARLNAWREHLQAIEGRDFALYLEDGIEFAAALLGAWQAGKTIWLAGDVLATSCSALRHVVVRFLGDFPAACAPSRPGAIATTAADSARLAPLPPGFPALVVYTSGTTGAAQAIPKRLSQLASEVATLEALFGAKLGRADIVATVSHQHIYGLLFKILWPLAAGRAIHGFSQNTPEALAQLLAEGACALVASPAHLKRLPDHLNWDGTARQLRAVFSSGGPLSAEAAHSTRQLMGQTPIEVYGSSETGGIAWRQRGDTEDASWRAMPGVEWRIAPPQDVLEVRSPHLADANWLALADQASAHGDQGFLLGGRCDRIAKIEEKRISLDAIEALLAASPLVSALRVLVCEAGPGQRQRLAAFVVLSEQGRALLDAIGKPGMNHQLRDLLHGAVEPVALPRRWRYLDRMPLDAQGKTTSAQLFALLDPAPAPSPTPSAPGPRPRQAQASLLARERERVELSLQVPADLLYFDGHFPQTPILPGVVAIDWAIEHGRRHFDLPPLFQAIHALKFQRVIAPGDTVTLELQHDAAKDSLQFRYYSSLGQHASGRILFRHE